MAEEEKINNQNSSEKERSWGEATIDVIGNIADTYSRTGRLLPSLVSGASAALNTDSFQQQKNKFAHDMFLMEQAKKAAQRADELHPLNMRTKELNVQNQEALLAANQMRLDNAFYDSGIKKAKNEALERFKLNPGYNLLNSDEKNKFDNSVQLQKLSEFIFFSDEFQNAYNSKDEQQTARLARMAAKDGLLFRKNDNGDYILSGNGFEAVINDENRNKIGTYLAQNAAKEYAAIFETSQKSTYARADAKLLADYANNLAATSKDNSLANNLAMVKKEIRSMPQSWRNGLLLRKMLDDALSSDISDEEKMQEVQMAIISSPDTISILEQEGYRFKAGPMGLMDGQFHDTKTNRDLNVYEMQKLLQERDHGRRYLDNLVQNKKNERLQLEAIQQRKQEIETIRLLNLAKNKGTGQKGAETGEVPAPTVSRNNIMALIDWFGEDLRGKSNNVFLNLQKAVNETRANSVQHGFGEQDANGNFRVSAKFTDDDLTHAKAIEKQAFKKYGMEDYAEKGFWHSVAAQVEAEKELNNSPKREKKIKQMDENIKNASRAAQSLNPLVQLGANDMAGSMMTTRALLGLFNKSKTDNALKKKESAQKRITAAGKIEPEKKKK